MGQRGAVNVLNSVNPTGSVFVDYNPNHRANTPLAKNIVSYDKTSGGSPDELVTIYRGLPKNQKNINSGDFVTTNKRLAQDYAGDGHVIKMTVKKSELLDDINEPLGEEYIYRKPQRPLTEFEQAHLTAQRNAALPVNQGGLGLAPDNTAMDRARAMGFDEADYYHGTDADISEFRGDTFATYTTDDPSYASTFKDSVNNVLPLKIKYSGVKQLDKELNHFNVNKYLNSKEHWLSDDVNAVKGIDAGSTSNATALIMPNQLRSRFAAFDPFNRDSSNLLAQSAKLAPTTAVGAYMYNEKRKKSQGNQ